MAYDWGTLVRDREPPRMPCAPTRRSTVKPIDPARIARAARVYASTREASQALGIAAGTFSRLCRQHAIETPGARRRRLHAPARPKPNR